MKTTCRKDIRHWQVTREQQPVTPERSVAATHRQHREPVMDLERIAAGLGFETGEEMAAFVQYTADTQAELNSELFGNPDGDCLSVAAPCGL